MTQNFAGGSRPVRVILHTDDTLLAHGATDVLSSLAQFYVVSVEPGLARLLPMLESVRPDIVLVDLGAEMTLGFLAILRETAPDARIVVWGTAFSEELRFQAREIGVAGFLPRNLSKEQFVDHLIGVARGDDPLAHRSTASSRKVPLTRRESQLVALLAQGLKNKEIATCIGITEGTVRVYLSKLFLKIGARDRFEVAVFGLKNAWWGQASWDDRKGPVTETDERRAGPIMRSLVLVEPESRGFRDSRAVGA
jgi:DNA-binding NarL/FixJ family response regulator